MPRKFPPEFKRDVVTVARRGDLTVAEVATDFDISPESVRRWMRQADIDDGVKDGLTTAEQSELVQLRGDKRRLEMENEDPAPGRRVFRQGHAPKMMYPLVLELAAEGFPVRLTCGVLGFSAQAFYKWRARPACERDWADAHLTNAIVDMHGHQIGRDQVARLMHAAGIRGASRAKKRFTTHADPAAVRAPDLVRRDFTAVAPNHKWVCDFTYCSTWSGVVYVAFVTDVFSRRIVGWKAARSMSAALVVDALNMAAWTRRGASLDGLICHSDAGSQYTSIAYTERLDDIGAAPSIGTVGDSFDNAMAESVISLFKTELHRNPAVLATNGGHWKGLDDLEVATCAWVSWFNEERLHGELGDHTPAEIEDAHYRDNPQALVA